MTLQSPVQLEDSICFGPSDRRGSSSHCSEHMHFSDANIVGAKLIDPNPHQDRRGRFLRAWCAREFADHGINFSPVQANMGFSMQKGTVRGMHFQEAPALEAKLVRCTRGAIFDVVLDLRPESPSYGKWYGVELSSENGRMLYVPEQCAHGYQTLEDCTEMYYMASEFYTPSAVRGVRFDDPAFGIRWPLPATVVSEQDHNWPLVERVGGGHA
jgi:dTDP-4-dehydrorhamnose 3,5-epimerase